MLHSSRGILTAEQKVESLVKECNETAYKNKLLARKLKDLKIQKKNIDSSIVENPVEIANSKIEDTRRKIELLNKHLERTKKEQKRLATIIGICLKNKMQNENWSNSLSYLLKNLKTLIQTEKESVKRNSTEISKIQRSSQSLFQMIREKIDSHIVFLQHVKTELANKDLISRRIGNIDEVMETSAIDASVKLEETYGGGPKNVGDDKKQMALIDKNNKKISELIEILEKEYEKIKSIVDDDQYEKSEKFQNFIAAIERHSDLEETALERNTKLERLRAQIKDKQIYLETLKKAAFNRVKAKEEYDITDEKYEKSLNKSISDTNKQTDNKIRQNQQIEKAIFDSKVSILTICRKLGIEWRNDEKLVKQVPYEEIHSRIVEKINFIKEKGNPEDYEKLWKGEYDFDVLYRAMIKAEPPGLNEAYQNNHTQDSINSQE